MVFWETVMKRSMTERPREHLKWLEIKEAMNHWLISRLHSSRIQKTDHSAFFTIIDKSTSIYNKMKKGMEYNLKGNQSYWINIHNSIINTLGMCNQWVLGSSVTSAHTAVSRTYTLVLLMPWSREPFISIFNTEQTAQESTNTNAIHSGIALHLSDSKGVILLHVETHFSNSHEHKLEKTLSGEFYMGLGLQGGYRMWKKKKKSMYTLLDKNTNGVFMTNLDVQPTSIIEAHSGTWSTFWVHKTFSCVRHWTRNASK